MRQLILTTLLLLSGISAAGQNGSQSDIQLAYSYYNSHEFDKAAQLFEELYSQSKSLSYFSMQIRSLLKCHQAGSAEKAARKQASASKGDPCYTALLGSVYKEQGRASMAQQEFSSAIEHIRADRSSIIQLANTFLEMGEIDYAEKALLKGQEASGLDLSQDLFSVYSSSRNFGKMSEAALNIIEKEPEKIFSVENSLQYHINNDINDEFYGILRAAVQQRIQQNPLTQFSELMIWLQIMRKNYKMAIIQAKALDKRLGEQGQRLITIGDQAIAAKDYASAADAYKYVSDKGQACVFYQKATFGMLKSTYEQVMDGSIADRSQIEYLGSKYESAIAEFGLSPSTIQEAICCARIQTYNLSRADSAQKMLESAAKTPGISYAHRAQINLELGDVQLYKGEPWDALMTYAKVENDNKQNEYGDEAKYRKARIAYYTGNFKWAASQLDVLKAATTKLVANDAMELRLLIADNAQRESSIPGDTSSAILDDELSSPDLRIYARADMLSHQNKHGEALASLDSIMEMHKTSPLVDEALYMKARIYETLRQYDSAATYYKRAADEYAYGILADKACFCYARLAESQQQDPEKAKEYYMRILSNYPGSIYAVEARDRYRAISGQ